MAGVGARVGARPSATQRRLHAGALTLGLVMIAGPALAQSASERAGLRTLTWPGKAEAPAARDQSRPQAASANTPAAPHAEPPAVQPSRLPDYTAAAASFPQSLTPATAFGVPPVAGGGQAYASAPVPYEAAAGGAAVRPTPVPQTPVPSTPVPQTPVSAPQDEQADPMAPRRDAAIWRLTDRGAQGQAEPQSQGAPQPNQPVPRSSNAGDRDGARYYSVHREAGREPDPTRLPAPFFLDSAPVDLAEPPPPPTLMRNQGGLAPSVADDAL